MSSSTKNELSNQNVFTPCSRCSSKYGEECFRGYCEGCTLDFEKVIIRKSECGLI